MAADFADRLGNSVYDTGLSFFVFILHIEEIHMAFTYRGLTAKLDRHIVTDEEVDRQLQRLQQQTPRIAVVTDRPTESGRSGSGLRRLLRRRPVPRRHC